MLCTNKNIILKENILCSQIKAQFIISTLTLKSKLNQLRAVFRE